MKKKTKRDNKLKMQIEYGNAVRTVKPIVTIKDGVSTVKYEKDIIACHRSGRKSGFCLPEQFKKLIYSKMRGRTARIIVEFALATYAPEDSDIIIYAIAVTHKSDNFRRNIAYDIVYGRVERYLKDKYEKYKSIRFAGTLPNGKQESISWVTNKPDFIHVEPKTIPTPA